MACVCRWILVCSLLLCAAPPRANASTPETRAFNAAANALRSAFYERAEAEFADFTKNFPASPRVPEAILFQAEARLEQTNYAGAIELLSTSLPKAGSWADQYLFWLAETQLRQGDSAKARESFAKLVQDFPASSRRLEASIGQAAACSRLGEWPRVLELLQQPTGVFQTSIRTNASTELMVRGTLLLSEAQLVQNQ
ncbi:MAG TPA: tetratricopeptide repeat protein, partial [Bacillota bacterium]|nr:tetratricopeptide repeat protein [Bacillota bacterium]